MIANDWFTETLSGLMRLALCNPALPQHYADGMRACYRYSVSGRRKPIAADGLQCVLNGTFSGSPTRATAQQCQCWRTTFNGAVASVLPQGHRSLWPELTTESSGSPQLHVSTELAPHAVSREKTSDHP